MFIFRAFNHKNKISVRNFNFLYKNFATQTTIRTPPSDVDETPALPSSTKRDELITENDVMVKSANITRLVEQESLTSTVSFDNVPGPKLLQHIARVWNFIPVFGNQVTTSTVQYMLSANHLLGSQLSWGRNAFIFRWMMDEYGPIVRLQGPFGGNILILSRPEDALSVFASEGRYPIRSTLDCIEKYRLEYRNYKHAGPFLMYGEEWEKLRNQIVDNLNTSTPYQFKHVELSSNEFIQQIIKIKNRQEEVPGTFWDELSKWSLECLCSVMLGQRLGFISGENITTSESARLTIAFRNATNAVRRCETGLHFWRFIETPAWKALVKNCNTIDNIFEKYLRDAEDNLQRKKENLQNTSSKTDIPLLESMLLQNDTFSPDDILTVFLDMMLIGVNAVTHSMSFLFYHLARYPRTQRILFESIKNLPDKISIENLEDLKYLKACIKESLRLKPPIPFISRVLTKDVTISNYGIPKGTVILMATFLSSIQEEHFDDALKFIPDRWLNDSALNSSLACIPFGYGPKACLARNLAEMQLSVLLIKVLRHFKIQYHYGDIKSNNNMLAYPDKPLKFRFETRHI